MPTTTADPTQSPSPDQAAAIDHIVLWLDLAEDNQQSEASVRSAVPPGAEILRLTDHGIAPCPEGTPQQWRPVLEAIDRLVRQARVRERRSPECRYWVTGRAGLPAFFYLGHRLGKMAAITFVHQPRNGGVATVMPLDGRRPGQRGRVAAYFEQSPRRIPHSESAAPVGLVLSSENPISDVQVEDAFVPMSTRPAAVVRGHAAARLDVRTMPAAMQEIAAIIAETCAAHPARKTLGVFIRGSTALAFLAGNALTPRVCRDIQVFHFDGQRYTPAYELPFPPVPERNVALWVGASPAGTLPLALDEEIRAVQLEQGRGTVVDRLTFVSIPNARPMDLRRELRSRKPGMIQFSGHGNADGPVFQDDHGQMRRLEASDLVELLRLEGDPVHLVVMAACYSEAYAQALLAHVDCVIVMRGRVGDVDVRRFAAELYRGLAEGNSVRVAFDHALQAMRFERSASDAGRRADDEAPRLHERDPGCASTLFLVRRP
ncbi:MAG TPA: CHAT domain-containing protein [Kofleriaceae bacterium]|nr:CHAT domain-containing protein [Kofleriaceae bacterium]